MGPNNSSQTSTNMLAPGDSDIELMLGAMTYDASILEFDIITSENDSLLFASFSFGSEEYPEFINSPYSDGAGIFVSGPGINGIFSNNAENLGQLPESNPPVYLTTRTINENINPEYYIENTEDYLQYDGFTTKIVNSLSVFPNETYHVKIVVSDAMDNNYDSGIFIEEGSIGTSPFLVIPSVINDHCGYNLGSISLNIDGYYPPYQYLWSTGETTSSIDSLSAGQYYVDITDSEGFYLSDTFQIESLSSPPDFYFNFTYFEDECLTEVAAYLEGEHPPFSYLWSDPAQQTTQTAILCPGTYNLTVTDSVGCEYHQDIEVVHAPDDKLQIGIFDNASLYAEHIVPEGSSVSNATQSGSLYSIGNFAGQSNIDFEDGIILNTGFAWTVEGPNNIDSTGFLFNTPGDSDLEILSGYEVHDAAILEFDFTSTYNIVDFYYVFGSEEYNELIDEDFPDVFGFFVSGEGLSGPFSNNAKNFAEVAGMNIPFNVNTVNNGFATFGVTPVGPCSNCEYYIFNDEHSISFNGLSTIQNISIPVVPNEIYHIKIAIADGTGRNLNSGLFVKSGEGEFTAVHPASSKTVKGIYKIYYTDNDIIIHPIQNQLEYIYSINNIDGSIMRNGNGYGETSISSNEFNNGIYLIKIMDYEGIYTQKLLVR
ncbi:MAG: hypothetical protein CVT99_02410 [Bacteroidetes bacterium HGW-Bacteroidetes-16]|nr:MAG: hypothetical protein CVT99_02410 [Bacteroidetes bacterium HGW-Bacteroidetes-16]